METSTKLALLCALSAFPSMPQVCSPDPEIKAAIDKLNVLPAAERLDAVRALRDQHPDNIWAHRAYKLRYPEAQRDTIIAEYSELLDAHPNDPTYIYAYAFVLVGAKSAEAILHFDAALEANPDLGVAHSGLIMIYASPNFRDAAKLKSHLAAYMKACPESDLHIFSHLERLDAPDLAREGAAQLRSMLEREKDENEWSHYRTLWAIEFKAHPASEQEAVRDQVRKDLERLRAADLASHRVLVSTLREGFKLIDDKNGLEWLDKTAPAAPSSSAVMDAYQKFSKEHPYGSDRAAMDKRNELLLKATAEWVQKWPDDEFAWNQRLNALMMKHNPADPALDEATSALLRLARKSSNSANLKITVASTWSNYRLHLDEVEPLIDEALRDLAKRSVPPENDLYPASMMANSRAATLETRERGLSMLSRFYSAGETKWDKLAALLPQWRTVLDEQKRAGFAQTFQQDNWKRQNINYWQSMAAVAEHNEKKLDALAYYRRALDTDLRSSNTPKFMLDSIISKAHAVWQDLGGSEDAWRDFNRTTGPISASPALTAVRKDPDESKRPLPPMTLKDLGGREWTLADLKGKATFIDVWATWCQPCIKELPLLEKLYQRVKDRNDIVILTLNTDDNPGLIAPFMKQNSYTFPVLAAREYVDTMVPSLAIPRNWMIDRNAVIDSAHVGFNMNETEAWIDKTVRSLENLRATGQ